MNTIQDIIRDNIIHAYRLLEWEEIELEIIKVINRTYEPEEVFDEQTLSNWAERNGYKKGET